MSTTPKSAAQRQVHPAASALLIFLVLGAVQFIWWRFLVYRPHGTPGGPLAGGGAAGIPETHIFGRADVLVRTFAGVEQPGATDGPAYAAKFDRPTGLAIDPSGALFVADTGNHRIRKVLPSGETSTFAGGEPGYADGPAAQARFNAPCGICLSPDGALYVADTGNHCIRKIKDGQVSTVGDMALANGVPAEGKLKLPVGVAFAPGASPSLLVADAGAENLILCSVDGKPQSDRKMPGGPTSVFGAPEGVAIPSAGTLILGGKTFKNTPFDQTDEVPADQAAKLTLKHPESIYAWGSNWLATDNDHGAVLMIVNGKARVLAGYCSSAGPNRGFRDANGQLALFGKLGGVVTDGKHNVFVADTSNNCIRRVDISELNSN